jgi:hypothetical protein
MRFNAACIGRVGGIRRLVKRHAVKLWLLDQANELLRMLICVES